MLLLIDNYDSFVFNIVHSLDYPLDKISVHRNDDPCLQQLKPENVSAVIISPGPMSPREANFSNTAIRRFGEALVPVLGICLGHQCIAYVHDCAVTRHPQPTHGRDSLVSLQASPLFSGLPSSIRVGRYHSLHVPLAGLNHQQLKVTASLDDGTVMALEHRRLPVYGVQFHPESVLSGAHGRQILSNFLGIAGLKVAEPGPSRRGLEQQEATC